MLTAFDLAPSGDNRRRQRIVIVHVAVAHVAAENNDRMIQQRAIAVGRFLELRQELCEDFGVIGLNLDQRGHSLRIILVMRRRVERVRNADVIVGLIARLRAHHHRENPRQVGLICKRDHVEHQVEALVERGSSRRHVRQIQLRQIDVAQGESLYQGNGPA